MDKLINFFLKLSLLSFFYFYFFEFTTFCDSSPLENNMTDVKTTSTSTKLVGLLLFSISIAILLYLPIFCCSINSTNLAVDVISNAVNKIEPTIPNLLIKNLTAFEHSEAFNLLTQDTGGILPVLKSKFLDTVKLLDYLNQNEGIIVEKYAFLQNWSLEDKMYAVTHLHNNAAILLKHFDLLTNNLGSIESTLEMAAALNALSVFHI
jgi:hypothetical protein